MKLKSILLSALMMGGVVMVSSCSQDGIEASYQPTAPEASLPAYFRIADDNLNIEVNAVATQVELTAFRASTGTALTVPVKLEGDENGLFSIPAQVTFPVDENSVVFPITFDNSELEDSYPYELKVTIGDGDATPYATQVVNITITKNAWEDVVGPKREKYATFYDPILGLYGVSGAHWNVILQKSLGKAGLYRICDPYTRESCPVTGLKEYAAPGNYIYVNVADPAESFLCDKRGNAITATNPAAPIEVDLAMTVGNDGQVFMTGMYNFRMAKGQPDVAKENAGKFVNNVLTFDGGTLLYGFMLNDEFDGWYANPNGMKVIWPGATELAPGEEWTSVGTAQYTDAWICPLYQMDQETYEVGVETLGNGKFRLVNPYKAGVMPSGVDYDGDIYMEFDVSNPDCVFVPVFYSGVQDEQNGPVYLFNKATAYTEFVETPLTPEQIISKEYNDTYDASTFTVTFKATDCFCIFPESPDEETAAGVYYCNADVEGKIVLTEEAATAAKLSVASSRNYTNLFVGALKKGLKLN